MPPRGVRRPAGLTSALVVATAGAAVVGGLAWATQDQVGDQDPRNAATALVPVDGTRRLSSDDGQAAVTEETRLTGPEMVLVTPPLVGGALATMLKKSSGAPDDWRIWRSVRSAYDTDAAGSTEQSTTLRQLTDDGILQLADYGAFTLVFDPPVLEVPADVHAGQTWSGQGDAQSGGAITYASSLKAAAATLAGRGGCLRISGKITFSSSGTPFFDLPVDETWCRGEGIVDDDGDAPPSTPPAYTGSAAPTAPDADPDDVADWSAHEEALVVAEAVKSAAKTGGRISPTIDLTPAARPDGGLALADGTGNDVLGLVPGTGKAKGALVRAWVGHPGGVISALGTSGDITVAGTAARETVAYGDHGQWLWTRRLPDVPATTPLGVDADHVVLTTVGGDVVALDPATGREAWHDQLSDQVRVDPVTDGHVVAATDVAGGLGVWDATSGEARWSADVGAEVLGLTISGDRLVALDTNGVVHAYALADGRRLWTRAITASQVGASLVTVGSTVVAASTDTTVGLDATDGHVAWHTPGAQATAAAGAVLLQTDDHVLVARDGDGHRLGRWPLALKGDSDFLVPAQGSVLVLDANGELEVVGP